MENDPQWNSPDAWTTYLHTADINSTVEALKAAGGTSCVDPMEVKDKGWMAMATDPTGAFFGLWQPTGHHGFDVIGHHGTPAWHQLPLTTSTSHCVSSPTTAAVWCVTPRTPP